MRTDLQSCLSQLITIVTIIGSVSRAEEPTAHVDPFIGTGGNRYVCANNPPGANVPFGMVRLSPDSMSVLGQTATNMSGYFYDDPFVIGFSHTRLCGTGAIDGGHFRVTPGLAETTTQQFRNPRLKYDHSDESASPGYYRVRLPEIRATAELTASTRVGLHRYTYDAQTTPEIAIDVGSALGRGTSKECSVTVDAESREIFGAVRTFGSFSGRFGGLKVYFVAHFLRPWESCEIWNADEVTAADGRRVEGDDVGVMLTMGESDGQNPVEFAVGISHVSIGNARENLKSELADRSFDDARQAATDAWNAELSRVRVEGGSEDDQTIFYTALYRSMVMPSTFTDVNDEYVGFDKQVHKATDFTYYTDMSLWDTFRTTHPLYTLLIPDRHRDMIRSLVAMARQGGSFPRWPSGIGYTNSMFGAPTEIAISEAWQKGIRDFDVDFAWETMKRAATAPADPDAPYSGRRGIKDFIDYGYCPSDTMSKAVAKTLEYCTTDAAIGLFAAGLGHDADAKLFADRAQNYRNVWNPETQFFQPRDSNGEFSTPLKPTLLTYLDTNGKYTDDYVEGSALQWRWSVSHDAKGLVALFSSPEYFVEQLEEFLEGSTPTVGIIPNGHYWQGNQPDIHAVYLFNAAGRPDLTQKWVRWILKHKHDTTAVGLDGNDDGGTLSAWYVFSSLGFYPVVGSSRYELGSPLWKKATIQVGDTPLKVIAENYAPDRFYVSHVELNGTKLNRTWLEHSELQDGGELRFVMSDMPVVPQQ